MFKKFFTALLSFSLCLGMVQTVQANTKANTKTSSLSAKKPAKASEKTAKVKLSAQCEKMFKLADTLVREAERQPGTHTQISKLKSKLSSTKQQISKMEADLQKKSCDKGLTALNTLKQKF